MKPISKVATTREIITRLIDLDYSPKERIIVSAIRNNVGSSGELS